MHLFHASTLNLSSFSLSCSLTLTHFSKKKQTKKDLVLHFNLKYTLMAGYQFYGCSKGCSVKRHKESESRQKKQ